MQDSVSVALRVRPLVKSELDRGCRICVQRDAADVRQVVVNSCVNFTYNHVFDTKDTQEDIYKACVQQKLTKLLQGFNVTILAYGQTGSGKTYTMGTSFDGIMDENVGVIPRAVHAIFEETAAMAEEYDFKITCSFVELYLEQFYDLFSANKREDCIVDIREDKNRVIMPGLTEVEVKRAKDVMDQLIRGSCGRAIAATAMNETSSRSHAIFTMTIVATKTTGQKSITTSKFSLVDLAGSERCAKTLASGDRFKEGVNINKGLLALGNVINILGSGQAVVYVPYRQSKLTRLLQDSLGGNSITLMIACVSPADYNATETLSTLRYADRALQIKNKPVVNVDSHASELKALKDMIQNLRNELLIANSGGAEQGGRCEQLQLQQLQESNAWLEKKNRRLQEQLHQAFIDLAELEMRVHLTEQTHDKLMAQVLELKQKLIYKSKEGHTAESEGEQQLLLMTEITQLVKSMDEELQQSQKLLQAHPKQCLHDSADSSSSSEESQDLPLSQTEKHTMKQLNLSAELRKINRQLGLKQDLQDSAASNLCNLQQDDTDEKYKQCELKIEQLEAERCELISQLRNTKLNEASVKLAEERRKRLQQLEQQICDMRRKIAQQENMLKMRDREREKIQNLSSEIRAMKASRVKLIRTMHSESERFRQWKIVNEKQLTQFKKKDRKMQSEIVRKETLHAKQCQVLRRKYEEAVASIKRLKYALEHQKAAQAQPQKHGKDEPMKQLRKKAERILEQQQLIDGQLLLLEQQQLLLDEQLSQMELTKRSCQVALENNQLMVSQEERVARVGFNMLRTIDSNMSLDDDTLKAAHCCKCHFSCKTNRCGCFALGNGCSRHCKCNMFCQNPYKGDKENLPPDSSSTSQNISSNILSNQSSKSDNKNETVASSNVKNLHFYSTSSSETSLFKLN